jgi:hypothetical protein
MGPFRLSAVAGAAPARRYGSRSVVAYRSQWDHACGVRGRRFASLSLLRRLAAAPVASVRSTWHPCFAAASCEAPPPRLRLAASSCSTPARLRRVAKRCCAVSARRRVRGASRGTRGSGEASALVVPSRFIARVGCRLRRGCAEPLRCVCELWTRVGCDAPMLRFPVVWGACASLSPLARRDPRRRRGGPFWASALPRIIMPHFPRSAAS